MLAFVDCWCLSSSSHVCTVQGPEKTSMYHGRLTRHKRSDVAALDVLCAPSVVVHCSLDRGIEGSPVLHLAAGSDSASTQLAVSRDPLWNVLPMHSQLHDKPREGSELRWLAP